MPHYDDLTLSNRHLENSMQKSLIKAHSGIFSLRLLLGKVPGAAIIYLAFAIYLYLPYFWHFKIMQYMILLNAVIGALGCFVLSQRWIGAFAGELFAGIIYGFSPFALGFAAYHPLAGLPFAILPWLFCPAVYWSKICKHTGLGQYEDTVWSTITTSVLSLLPFILIALFFLR